MTGGRGGKDADGYCWSLGREDDVITSAGYRIGPGEIEDCLVRHPAVALAAVIGIPDKKWGERPMALIVLNANAALDAEAVKAHVTTYVKRGVLSQWAIPEHVEFVAALAQTSVGKIDKKLLREQYS